MNQVLSLKCIALHITHMCIRVGGCCCFFAYVFVCVRVSHSYDHSLCVMCMQKPSLDKCAFKHFVSPCAKCALAIHVTLRKLAMNAQLTTLYAESFKAQQERQRTKKKLSRCNFQIFSFILMAKWFALMPRKTNQEKTHTHITNSVLLLLLYFPTSEHH